MKLNTKDYEEKMKKTVAGYSHELQTVRVGRANVAVLDRVTVDYYGAPTRIADIAAVKATDARTLTVTPWESNMLKPIERAIQASDVGINPVNDGKCVRLSFPQLTGERRKELTKQVAKMGEDAKVAIRNIRRDANDKIKDMKKNSEMTEDEQKLSEKAMQDLTDKYTKELDVVTEAKNKEILEI
ncbi:MAG: ribosome recycling factor [Lachnospiraceae bacterium]|nr:ribosome recycling factor [Lachnospiraceae bacterium]